MAKRRNDDDEPAGLESRYDEALLSANWNPVIDLLGHERNTREEPLRDSSRGPAPEDPEAFLKRFYKLGN